MTPWNAFNDICDGGPPLRFNSNVATLSNDDDDDEDGDDGNSFHFQIDRMSLSSSKNPL